MQFRKFFPLGFHLLLAKLFPLLLFRRCFFGRTKLRLCVFALRDLRLSSRLWRCLSHLIEVSKHRLKNDPRQILRNAGATGALLPLHRSVKRRHDVNILAGRTGSARSALVMTRDARTVVKHRAESIATVRASVARNPLSDKDFSPVDRDLLALLGLLSFLLSRLICRARRLAEAKHSCNHDRSARCSSSF